MDMSGHQYPGEYRSGIARAKKILLKAGFEWSRTTGHYSPFASTQHISDGVKVTRVGVSGSITIHVHMRHWKREEAFALKRRAIEALRAGGLPFDDRGWLECKNRYW